MTKTDIVRALASNWLIDSKKITVVVSGKGVTLYGTIKTFILKDEAERIARNFPGVWTVHNELQVLFSE